MKIKIKNIEDGVHEYNFSESPENLGLDKPFSGSVDINCKMDKSLGQFILDCNLNVHADFECDRCSKEFGSDLDKNFKLYYFFDKENIDESDSNMFYLAPETDYIDITNEVRDYALLSIPMKVLCDENCKGLCAGCGVDLNVEKCKCKTNQVRPEWEELLKIKDKINKQG